MVMDYRKRLAESLYQALEGQLDEAQIYDLIEKPKKEFGDFAFPCFQLARTLRKAPPLIAKEIAEKLNDPLFSKVEAVGPYVNVFLNRAKASEEILSTIIREGNAYGSFNEGQGKNVTIDLSSPNIAKPFSMGHLRSTVIGTALANLAEKMGYKAVRINHLGDWGTQFGKLIVAYQKWGDEEAVKQNPISELLKLYVRFHEEAEKNPELEEEGRAAFKRLEDGDPEATRLWQWFRDESLKEFSRIYDLMEISFDSYAGEAFYNDKMDAVIELLKEKNLLVESQGAMVVPLEEEGLPPCLIQKTDGASLYATRDLAAAIYRKNTYDFAKSLYVVGNEQTLHFKQLKLVLKKAGFDWADDMIHIGFGMMLQNGKKMSTRKGRVILLEEVLREAIELAQKIIEEKNPNLENKEEVARQVGIGAVIFHDLKHYRTNDVEFSLEAMLNFDGETAPYIQYTHARCHSILRKAGFTQPTVQVTLDEEEAWPILTLLSGFGETVKQAWYDFDPSKIARFALDLARAFNQYYAHVRIIGSEQEEARLNLVYAVATLLEEALRLLNIRAPKEM